MPVARSTAASVALFAWLGVCLRYVTTALVLKPVFAGAAATGVCQHVPYHPDSLSNMVGCFVMGVLVASKSAWPQDSLPVYTGLSTGMAGCITTFSGWQVASYFLVRDTMPEGAAVALTLWLLQLLAGFSISLAAFSAGRHVGGVVCSAAVAAAAAAATSCVDAQCGDASEPDQDKPDPGLDAVVPSARDDDAMHPSAANAPGDPAAVAAVVAMTVPGQQPGPGDDDLVVPAATPRNPDVPPTPMLQATTDIPTSAACDAAANPLARVSTTQRVLVILAVAYAAAIGLAAVTYPPLAWALAFSPVGALLRWSLGQRFNASGFPRGTLAANILGVILVAALMLLQRRDLSPSSPWHASIVTDGLIVGLAGSLSTVSTWINECVSLPKLGLAYRYAVVSIATSQVVCVVLGVLILSSPSTASSP